MFKIAFYVPASHLETVKDAMFSVGAGKIGNYANCAWQVLGEGQFMPLEHSNAFSGEKNKLEIIPEYYVAMVCADDCIQQVVTKLKHTHPYEAPAFMVTKLEPF